MYWRDFVAYSRLAPSMTAIRRVVPATAVGQRGPIRIVIRANVHRLRKRPSGYGGGGAAVSSDLFSAGSPYETSQTCAAMPAAGLSGRLTEPIGLPRIVRMRGLHP